MAHASPSILRSETVHRTGTESPAPDPGFRLAAQETASCANEETGYSVEYPGDWHTNDGEVACSYFDPEPLEVPPATEFFEAAVAISREPAPIDAIAGEDPATRVIESEETEIAGRPAVSRETEATGDALFPEGTRRYQYLVDLDGETLTLTTYDVAGQDFERNRTVLAEIAGTLQLSG